MSQEEISQPRMRQLVDWSAAIWAGIIAGALSLGLSPLLFKAADIFNLLSYPILGETTVDGLRVSAVLVGILVHLIASLLFGLLTAFLLHRWGIIIGVFGGALLGLALYAINFYAIPEFLPNLVGEAGLIQMGWLREDWRMVLMHVLFGATAGGIYESLEVEEFVPAYDD